YVSSVVRDPGNDFFEDVLKYKSNSQLKFEYKLADLNNHNLVT
ncbi:11982_t:CDS:1, partial [Funneliformis mosseae]